MGGQDSVIHKIRVSRNDEDGSSVAYKAAVELGNSESAAFARTAADALKAIVGAIVKGGLYGPTPKHLAVPLPVTVECEITFEAL